ncbi:hypothetical protein FZC79_06950 [Rossellomorea vietnamensis]|uniref:Uncharacterized protein n=2 Tax=Rossellomorea TaxID=2837508 RepID=A0A5D4KH76_9BACI|nr:MULTISPECIES: hypothetical protein [Rossellomorea]TYR76601.1 hypothetical protein FZC79_06950 [Rossellomorea vietnamensis]TYS82700.1 hypothetical protein FZC80_03945 [Rossellomorea aquimaris]
MNITLFYKKMSFQYFKRAVVMLLLAVLLSVFIRGLHILFYLTLILLGISCVFMYLIYEREVKRSRAAIKSPADGNGACLVVIKKDKTYNFFGFDGVMKGCCSSKNGSWKLDISDIQAILKKGEGSVELECQGDYRKFVKIHENWNDAEGNAISLLSQGEGWSLTINDKKVCSITRGRMSAEIQQLFDPSSIILRFEKVDDEQRIWGILFLVLYMDNYYLI